MPLGKLNNYVKDIDVNDLINYIEKAVKAFKISNCGWHDNFNNKLLKFK